MVWNVSINPLTGKPTFSIFSIEEGASLFERMFAKKDSFLDYSVQRAAEFYGDGQDRWVFQEGAHGARTPLAYELLFDYRTGIASGQGWGTATVTGAYNFPAELVEHRSAMIERMKKEKRIKDNSRIPRVSKLKLTDRGPELEIQIAEYYDQVGTNLTLDCKLPHPIVVGSTTCKTAREWDCAQSGSSSKKLPSFEDSRLANSIGVGVGLSALDSRGVKHFVYRYRTPNAPVYPNTWHLPVSFALEIAEPISEGNHFEVEALILRDFPEELSTEAQLLRRDFGPLRPLAFCRDLTRGGKPQFFAEIECKLSLAELISKIGSSSPEYVDSPRALPEGGKLEFPISPELACFLALRPTAKNA